MTAEKLHDALNLLPGDLIAETDALRSRPVKQKIHWSRLSALAACLAVMLFTGVLFRISMFRAGSSKDTVTEMAMQAPTAAETFAVEEDAPESPAEERSQDSLSKGAGPDTGHAHTPAAETGTAEDAQNGYCGNTSATVYIDGEAYTISGSYAIALTDILEHLPYDPEKICRCLAEFTVDTEFRDGYEVSLTEYFVRCANGQAGLTETQAQTIREIVERLKSRS
ncbi:MAG: hypothetical protein ACI3V5_00900 [Faecousia sp.]